MFGATMHRQTRMGIATEENKRIRLIVAQQHVVPRLVQLDIVVLKQQRFRLGMGDGHVDLRDQRHQRFRFTRREVAAEVAAEPLFQIFGFANIDDGSASIIHPIHTGLASYRFQESFCVKNITHWLANDSALHRPWRIARWVSSTSP